MIFDNVTFIKPNRPFVREYTGTNLAPMFRRRFTLDEVRKTTLSVCALGYGYPYINGKPVSEDLLTAPVSDYRKTLWYVTYDVTALLQKGENVIAVWCGNGWFNEEFQTSWNHNEATWRDVPKVILTLETEKEIVLSTADAEQWKCLPESAVRFNALRSGETFDARLYDDTWTSLSFDDSQWESAQRDLTPPTGVFRLCTCEPIRACALFPAKEVRKTGENRFVFDVGQNISGFIKLTVHGGEAGGELSIRYAEQLQENGELELNRMSQHYRESPFQTDRVILSGKPFSWSPKFCYHGFRYIEITGISSEQDITVAGVFAHQDVKARTTFSCSDELLNTLFRCGQYSVLSNMFYMITDCPTREKLGWANDAQSSVEQILTNFHSERVYRKWLTDIFDAMREDGAMPGIIPTGGWGFDWGNGPVSDGVMFEVAYRLYLHTGDKQPLSEGLPYFDRYFAYLKTREDENGYVGFGLDDWARPANANNADPTDVPTTMINAMLIYRFRKIAALAARLNGLDDTIHESEADKLAEKIKRDFIGEDGTCIYQKQTAVSMLLYYHLYDRKEPLAAQLKTLVETTDFHHDCGMVGIRRLYYALNDCGLEEYAYRILTSSGVPSYRQWVEEGATTLWEYWGAYIHHDSKNHQMYSDFMSWMIKTILGIRCEENAPAYRELHLNPCFLSALTWAKGSLETGYGTVSVAWEKKAEEGYTVLSLTVPAGIDAWYGDIKLAAGKNTFRIANT